VLKATFATGDTYAYPPDISEEAAHQAWIVAPQATYVAVSSSVEVVGTYILKPNQPGLGSHVCNCAYVVAQSARGQGIATRMCEHSQEQARKLGYRDMQFNLVVSTNHAAVALWKRLGFSVVGTVPGAFCHSAFGYVDAYVMHKHLAAA
jgi:ribosomal protein S18 acetylase RimI-like enzyme